MGPGGAPGHLVWPPFVLILIAHISLSVWYSIALPILENSDEAAHYANIRYLITERRLPPITPATFEAHQPPLYYLLGALLTFWVTDTETPAINPYWGYDLYRSGVDNKSIYLHSPAESFPYYGLSLAVHLVRWLSVVFGASGIVVVYATVSEVFPRRPNLIIGTTAFAGFLPGYLSSVSGISNDSLAILLGSSLIFLTIRGVRRGITWQSAFWIGCLGGILLLTKLSTAFVLGPALLAVMAGGFPRPLKDPSVSRFLKRTVAAIVPLCLLSWPWFIRNLLVYGELTNVGELDRVIGVIRKTPLAFTQLIENSQIGLDRFWIQLGIGQITAPAWVYMFLTITTWVALMGLGRRALIGLVNIKRRAADDGSFQGSVAIVIFAVLGIVGLFSFILVNLHGAQPRLFLLPALPAIAPLLSLGWVEWLPKRWRPRLVFPLIGLLFLFPIGVLQSILSPAFAQPRLGPAEPWPIQPLATPVRFGKAVELMAAQLGPARVLPGEELTARLCWRILATTPTPTSLFVQLLDKDLNKIGERETYPGLGRLSSVFWLPQDRFCDNVNVRIKEWAGGPALLPLIVGYFDENGTLPIFAGAQSLEMMVVAQVIVAATGAPDLTGMVALQASLDNRIDLIGYKWLSPTGGPSVKLRLFWQPRVSLEEDYVVFVHWLTADGTLLGQHDSPPRADVYPTSQWLIDEIVSDDHDIQIDPQPYGVTRLEIGMYVAATGERLGTTPISVPVP